MKPHFMDKNMEYFHIVFLIMNVVLIDALIYVQTGSAMAFH